MGWQTTLPPSEVNATIPAICLISSCLPGQRSPSATRGAAAASAPTSTAATATAAATRSAGSAGLVGSRGVLGQQQALGIVAIRVVELPVPGQVHSGGRCLCELFGCARRNTYQRHRHEDSHPAILNEACPGGYIENQPAERWALGAERRLSGPHIHTRPSKG